MVQQHWCNHYEIEPGIAMNAALMENLFVTTICIFNRLPIFVVGKPGSSKTLTMQVRIDPENEFEYVFGFISCFSSSR